jgi:hypothetical protein
MEELTELEKLAGILENTNPKEWAIPESEAGNKYSATVGDCTYVLSKEKPEIRTFKVISPDDLNVVNMDISLPSKYRVEVRKGDATLQNFAVMPFASDSEETYRRIDALFKNLESGSQNGE